MPSNNTPRSVSVTIQTTYKTLPSTPHAVSTGVSASAYASLVAGTASSSRRLISRWPLFPKKGRLEVRQHGAAWHYTTPQAASPHEVCLPMADAGPNPSDFRALELLCRQQAALATDEATRSTLLGMAAEYRQQAERLERDQPERD